MASRKYKKQKQRKQRPPQQQQKASKSRQQPLTINGSSSISKKTVYQWALAVIILTGITLYPSINGEFIFWDDPEYTFANPHIKEIDMGQLFGEFYFGNYHPLTMLSYALDYKFFELDPKPYHVINLLLHLLNTFLVFLFVFRLLGRQQLYTAAITAALFGIHPMHVESVAWVSERKDVLYTAFYLGAMLTYLRYLGSGKSRKFFIYTLLLFLGACFSKAMAVTLPMILLLIDYFVGRQLNFKLIIEKLPLFAMSLIFGFLAINAQQEESAINPEYYKGIKWLVWGSYGATLYLYKALLPLGLSGVHPYPLELDRSMSPIAYIGLAVMVVTAILVWRASKKGRTEVFGVLFFFFSISTVLKFIPVGDVIIAERYSYMPYIGLFFIVGSWFQNWITGKLKQYKTILISGMGAVVLLFAWMSYQRTAVWHDTMSFWSDVMEKKPNYWLGYNNTAHDYFEKGEYELAIEYYTKATEMDPHCPPVPYLWRGLIYTDHLPNYNLAVADFEKVLTFPNKADQSYMDATINLGLAYYRQGNYTKAIEAHNNAIASFNTPKSYFLRGLVYKSQQQHQPAIQDFSAAVQMKPDYWQAFLNRGVIYTDKLGQYDLAIADFQKVIQLNPQMIDATLNLGLAYYKKGNHNEAIRAYNNALAVNQKNAKALHLRSLALAAKGEYQKAVNDAMAAQQLGYQVDMNQVDAWRNR